ncbi:MAG: hypothetical protein LBD61_00475, partial [Endomicrobium sp.]|nr:hypothetical protein [Endomicrobium sp.]
GKRIERKEEEIGYGVFCEYGNGEYKAENRFGIEEVKARGENEYIGVGLEEELSGKIKAKAEGKEIEKVSLEGMTMIGEAGVKMDISERLKLEVKGESFVGKREGLLGMVKVKYAI